MILSPKPACLNTRTYQQKKYTYMLICIKIYLIFYFFLFFQAQPVALKTLRKWALVCLCMQTHF